MKALHKITAKKLNNCHPHLFTCSQKQLDKVPPLLSTCTNTYFLIEIQENPITHLSPIMSTSSFCPNSKLSPARAHMFCFNSTNSQICLNLLNAPERQQMMMSGRFTSSSCSICCSLTHSLTPGNAPAQLLQVVLHPQQIDPWDIIHSLTTNHGSCV